MIDLVHDVGEGYRQLVNANSYPGRVYDVSRQADKAIETNLFYKATQLLIFMLLDSEVSFAVVGEKSKEAAALISKYTFSKETELDQADFIFILNPASEDAYERAIVNAKAGTLIDPHHAATLIVETASVSAGLPYRLRGPGIPGEKDINMAAYFSWEALRAKKNAEYPLGIEMYFVDTQSNIMALPRTTIVKAREA